VISMLANMNLLAGKALGRSTGPIAWIARSGSDPQHSFPGTRGAANRHLHGHHLRQAFALVANSVGLSEAVRSTYTLEPNRVKTIYNPVPISQIQALAQEQSEERSELPVLLSLGRISRVKRLDILLEAFQHVLAAKDCELWLCGPPDDAQADVQRAIDSSPALQRSVRILGHKTNPYAVLSRARIVVSASDHEGLPNALLEAHALGIPVVSTDSNFGANEVVEHQETGLITPRGRAKELAEAILSLLDSDELHQRMSQAAKARIQRLFAAEKILPQWESLILEACHTKRIKGQY
jgi:glycosyltransferase involved in cell wall biosynthesis